MSTGCFTKFARCGEDTPARSPANPSYDRQAVISSFHPGSDSYTGFARRRSSTWLGKPRSRSCRRSRRPCRSSIRPARSAHRAASPRCVSTPLSRAGVAEGNRIEPTAPPRPARDRAVFVSAIAQVLARGVVLLRRKGSAADARRIRLHDANALIHVLRRHTRTAAMPTPELLLLVTNGYVP